MTYFHINLDPRGQKKNVLPPILIPVGTVWLFYLFVLHLIPSSGFQRCVFREVRGASVPEGATSGGVVQAVWAS